MCVSRCRMVMSALAVALESGNEGRHSIVEPHLAFLEQHRDPGGRGDDLRERRQVEDRVERHRLGSRHDARDARSPSGRGSDRRGRRARRRRAASSVRCPRGRAFRSVASFATSTWDCATAANDCVGLGVSGRCAWAKADSTSVAISAAARILGIRGWIILCGMIRQARAVATIFALRGALHARRARADRPRRRDRDRRRRPSSQRRDDHRREPRPERRPLSRPPRTPRVGSRCSACGEARGCSRYRHQDSRRPPRAWTFETTQAQSAAPRAAGQRHCAVASRSARRNRRERDSAPHRRRCRAGRGRQHERRHHRVPGTARVRARV